MLNTDAVEYKSKINKPPHEEFDADIFAGVDQCFPLIDFSVVFSSSDGWIIEIGDLIRQIGRASCRERVLMPV